MPSPLRARTLGIGDELTLGRTVDTNSSWLARHLADRGLAVAGMATVGDGEAAIVRAIRTAARDADLVVCTGGLGPTDDDRTRHALARAAGVPLEERPAAWRHIVGWYAAHRPGLAVPAANRRQALFPRGAVILANDRGTAPGMLCRIGRAWVACYPGVPHEMRAMHEAFERRLPRLLRGLQRPAIGEVWFAGVGESQAQERLGDLLSEAEPMVGITVSELGHITLRAVGTSAQVRARLPRLAAAVAAWRLPAAGLAPSLVQRLTADGRTITCAESVSGGHIAAQLTAVPGASAVLRAGFLTYANAAKTRLVGVPARDIARHGVVSEAVALAMARGARRAAGADLAVATTGIAGPGGGSAEQPVGTVWVAAADRKQAVARRLQIRGERTRIQARAAGEALLLAWQLETGRLVVG